MGSTFNTCLRDVDYSEVQTRLTEEEMNILCNHNGEDLTKIIAKLESEENAALLRKIQAEEKKFLTDAFGIPEEELDYIIERFGVTCVDRSIFESIYDDVCDFGYSVATKLGLIDANDPLKETYYADYFDFFNLGNDMLSSSPCCHKLSDGRIVVLTYYESCGSTCNL